MALKRLSFTRLLEEMRKKATSTKHLGDMHEAACREFLKYSPDYRWTHVAKPKTPDRGIDLLATDRDGEVWAIQCKCHEDKLHYDGNVTNLWVEAKVQNIPENRCIIMTASLPTNTLEKQCQKTGVHIITAYEMNGLDWQTFDLKTSKLVPPEHKPQKMKSHQQEAFDECIKKFDEYDRGQLIMACGSGKTLVAQRVSETVAHKGRVLYLIPSISLAKQTRSSFLENYIGDSRMPPSILVVCSDKSAAKSDEDISVVSLPGAVSTSPEYIIKWLDSHKQGIVFCTYQSAHILKGQEFDIAIFDEAHRTTGKLDKTFAFAHDDKNIKCKKRLYQTATPRVYTRGGEIKDVVDMSDENIFGPVFYQLTFSQAIKRGILADYKVLAFEMDMEDIAKEDNETKDEYNETANMEYRTKLRSVYNALIRQSKNGKINPLGKVMVFHNSIRASKNFAGDIKSEDESILNKGQFEVEFARFANVYKDLTVGIKVKAAHVDGTSSAAERKAKLDVLKDSDKDPTDIRIVSNVRCFSEGVDVPDLNAVVFFEPRKSVIDVIQSVGRVMRRKSGKEKIGYIIIPVAMSKDAALGRIQREKTQSSFEILKQVSLALRAHDDRIENWLRNMSLMIPGENRVVSTSSSSSNTRVLRGSNIEYNDGRQQQQLPVPNVITDAGCMLYAMELNAGFYWDEYGHDLGISAAKVRVWLEGQSRYAGLLYTLHENLQAVIGDTITLVQSTEVLAQHVVLRELFETLFPNSKNSVATALDATAAKIKWGAELNDAKNLHKEMQKDKINDILKNTSMRRNLINKVYENFFVGFDKLQAKTIVYTPTELTDFIIKSVDHILKKEFDADLGTCKDVRILDPAAGTGAFLTAVMNHCHDVGTTFQHMSKLYTKRINFSEIKLLAYYVACANLEMTYQQLQGRRHRFKNGILADTLTIPPDKNIPEQTKLTDMYWKKVQSRRNVQRDRDIRVIVGNPPWSGGARTADEAITKVEHPLVEGRIRETYMERIPDNVTMKRGVLNEYLKFLRWCSDRIGESGIIGFVIPNSWLTASVGGGVRACLLEEFSDIWVYDLRGQRGKTGDGNSIFGNSGTEGGKTVGVCVAFFVKKSNISRPCKIHYSGVLEDDFYCEQKRDRVSSLGSIQHVKDWKLIKPDKYHNWLNQQQGMDRWEQFIPLGTLDAKKAYRENDKLVGGGGGAATQTDNIQELFKRHHNWQGRVDLQQSINKRRFRQSLKIMQPGLSQNEMIGSTTQLKAIFTDYSNGLKTHRDEWIYNNVKEVLN